jgi:hypothetical protein
VTRRAVVGMLLIVGLLVGLAYQPDVGTAAHLNSAGLTDHVTGTNHAKPLPRVVTVVDIMPTATGALLALVALVLLVQVRWAAFAPVAHDGGRHRSVFRSLVRARRGPPALALG